MFNVDDAIFNALKCLEEKNHPFLKPTKLDDGSFIIPTLLLIESCDNRVVELIAEKDATIEQVVRGIAMGVGHPDSFNDLVYFACDPKIANSLLVLKSTISPFSNFMESWFNGNIVNDTYDKSTPIYTLTDDKTDDRGVLVSYVNELFTAKNITKTSLADFMIFSRIKDILTKSNKGDVVYSSTLDIVEKDDEGLKIFKSFNFILLVGNGEDIRAHSISCII